MTARNFSDYSRRALSLLGDPERLRRVVRRYHHKSRFRWLASRSSPVPVPRDADVAAHVLLGQGEVLNAVATLKSLFRFLDTPFAVVAHDDGSLTAADVASLEAHLPGIRVIPRHVADVEVTRYLRQRGLERCLALRESLVFALKLFDLQFYGTGRALVYVDTDILFLQEPTELLRAVRQPAPAFVDRYNEDVGTNYAWPISTIEEQLHVPMLPQVNAGLMCIRRDALDWEFYERCLAIPGECRTYYAEQTLNAIDISRRNGQPLPPEYDVAFRNSHRGDYYEWLKRAPICREAVTQHYCGSALHRAYYFEHFVRQVAPALG